MRYYDDASEWTKIKDFNDLEDTTLVPGQIVEIPK
jgi:nucleoid-associated protein YgaU